MINFTPQILSFLISCHSFLYSLCFHYNDFPSNPGTHQNGPFLGLLSLTFTLVANCLLKFTHIASSFSSISYQLKCYLFREGSLKVICHPVILCYINLLVFFIIAIIFNFYVFILSVLSVYTPALKSKSYSRRNMDCLLLLPNS